MGQKSSRFLFVVDSKKNWHSKWFADDKKYPIFASEDVLIRKYFTFFEKKYLISKIEIQRISDNPSIIINTCKPGSIVGKVDQMKKFKTDIDALINSNVSISTQNVKRPDLDAKIVALSIATQIENRFPYKKATKLSIENVMRFGAIGIKISVAGRLNGAEIARSEMYKKGSVPLHTIRADIDYAYVPALTTYGVIGIKVWINRPFDFSRRF